MIKVNCENKEENKSLTFYYFWILINANQTKLMFSIASEITATTYDKQWGTQWKITHEKKSERTTPLANQVFYMIFKVNKPKWKKKK